MHYTRLVLTSLLGLVLLSFSACENSQTGASFDYKTMAWNDAVSAGIPAQLFVKQINEESGFNPNAISPAGAIGIAQFMPDTARGLGINPYDPISSLNGASHLMASYVSIYGDYSHALAAYNCGTYCLNRAMQSCSYYYWCLPPETERYIDIITS